MTAHVTPSRDGSSFRGCFCSCSAAHLCRHAPADQGHRRRADGNGNDAAASSTQMGMLQDSACNLTWRQRGKQTISQCGRMAQGYWPQRRTSSGSPGLRSFGSNKQGPWLLRQLQSVTSHYTCLLATYYSCCKAIHMHLAYAWYELQCGPFDCKQLPLASYLKALFHNDDWNIRPVQHKHHSALVEDSHSYGSIKHQYNTK